MKRDDKQFNNLTIQQYNNFYLLISSMFFYELH